MGIIEKICEDYFRYDYLLFRITEEKKNKNIRLEEDFYRQEKNFDFIYISFLYSLYNYLFFIDTRKARYVRKTLEFYLKYKIMARKIYKEIKRNGKSAA